MPTAEHRALAVRVLDGRSTKVEADQLAVLLAARDAGMSTRSASSAADISKTTALTLLADADQLRADWPTEVDRPLAVVGAR